MTTSEILNKLADLIQRQEWDVDGRTATEISEALRVEALIASVREGVAP